MPSSKEANAAGKEKQPEEKKATDGSGQGSDSKEDSKAQLTPLQVVVANVTALAKSVAEKDSRGIHKAIRKTTGIRRTIVARNLGRLAEFLPNDVQTEFLGAVKQVEAAEAADAASEDVAMDGSGDGSEAKSGEDATPETAPEVTIESSPLPEVHVYVQLLALNKLLQYRLNEQALAFAAQLQAYAKKFNRRTLDALNAKVFSALSLAHERAGSLESIRGLLMKAHRTSSLRHDEIGKATLLNLLLRNYLHYNLYEQANKLRLRAAFPRAISDNQHVRYLFYTARIHAVHMDYSDAHESLTQAARKAPTSTAVGFRCTVHRLLTVVKLLMGDLPDRAVFREAELRAALRGHFRLAQAVRVGDLELFNKVLTEFEADFKSDSTYSLILRLRNNVIKAGLRKLSVAYSTISFADIATKLHLGSAEDAAFLTAKAIKDGVVDGRLDHERGALVSSSTTDVYSTTIPQDTFHTRIKFCLDVHSNAVRNMVYPPNAHRQRAAVEQEEEEMDPEEIAKAVAEEDDE